MIRACFGATGVKHLTIKSPTEFGVVCMQCECCVLCADILDHIPECTNFPTVFSVLQLLARCKNVRYEDFLQLSSPSPDS